MRPGNQCIAHAVGVLKGKAKDRAYETRKRANDQSKLAEEKNKLAEEKSKLAEEKSKLAEDQTKRATLLAEKLRSLGIDPDELSVS